MPFCGKCGGKVNDSAAYCPNCGNAIKHEPLPGGEPTPPTSSPKEPHLFTWKKIIVGVTILIAIIIIAFIIVHMSNTSPEKLLEGRWVSEDNSSMGFEFLSNGDMMIFAESMTIGGATWKISDEILEIYDPMEEEYLEMTVDFDALENGTLILNMDGDELVLYKDE